MELFPLIVGCAMVGVGLLALVWAARSRVRDVESELDSQRPLTRLLTSGSIDARSTARLTVAARWLLGIVLVAAGVSG
jgi:hypothetical protein